MYMSRLCKVIGTAGILSGLYACQPQMPADSPTPPLVTAVHLVGAVQKGPFVIGSTVNVSPVDSSANPTGQVFNTKITSNLGTFQIDFMASGRVALEGVGFYYNEVTGQLSKAPLTLRALYEITASGQQNAYINLVTHLTYDRVKTLTAAGMSASTATTQAELELRQELGIGGAGFMPGKSGIEMNILGGNTDANAYLLAVSSVVAKVAVDKDAGRGSVDAVLQELLNVTALDLSDDGRLENPLKSQYQSGQRNLDVDQVRYYLQARLTEVGSSAAVPELDKVIDTDGDGFINATDTCPLVSNPDQMMIPIAVCRLRANAQATPVMGQYQALIPGKFGATGAFMAHSWSAKSGDKVTRIPYTASGMLTAGQDTTYAPPASSAMFAAQGKLSAGDVDGDGFTDLFLIDYSNNFSRFWVYRSDGNGGFEAPKSPSKLAPNNDKVNGVPFTGYMSNFVVADFNKDGLPDVLGNFDTSLVVMLQQAGGTFSAPAVAYATRAPVVPFASDWNGDGKLDVVVLDYDGTNANVRVLHGDGTGSFTAGSTATLPTAGTGIQLIGGTDFNQDGIPDLVVQVDDKGMVKLVSSRLYVLTSALGGFTVAPALVITNFDRPQLGRFTGTLPQVLINSPVLGGSDGSSLLRYNLSIASWDGTKLTMGPKTPVSLELNLRPLSSPIELNGDGKSDLLGSRIISDTTAGQSQEYLTAFLVN